MPVGSSSTILILVIVLDCNLYTVGSAPALEKSKCLYKHIVEHCIIQGCVNRLIQQGGFFFRFLPIMLCGEL